MTYALYRLYDLDGRLLYIGQSANPLSRIGSHVRTARARQVARVELEHLPEGAIRADAVGAERFAIIAERPVWNVKQAAVAFGPPAPHDIVPAGVDTVSLVAAAPMVGRKYESLVASVCVWGRARHWRTADGVQVAVDDLPVLRAATRD